MMLSTLHRLVREEDGQALVLSSILLLVVAMAVLSISDLGRAIHDRIELQNAADGAAYTLAVREARAFNYYAYTNRAQVAQYVTALQLLSIDSMVLGILVGLGTVAALMKTAADVCGGAKRELCRLLPKIGWILIAISTAANAIEKIARMAARAIKAFDAFIGAVAVPLLVGANLFLFASQVAFLSQTVAGLRGEEVRRIARATSPRAELALGVTPHTAANGLRFLSTHLQDSMLLFGTNDPPGATLDDGAAGRRNWARRGMGELIHASRSGPLIYDRSLPGPLVSSSREVPGVRHVENLMKLFGSAGFRGHTRLHSRADVQPTPASSARYYEQLEEPGYSTARYPTGNSVGANFYFHVGGFFSSLAEALGLNRKELASVTSTGGPVKGWACSWDPDRPYRTFDAGLVRIFAPRFGCDLNRGRHPWWGITPYMAFDPTRDGCEDPARDFCQPDVWVALRLPLAGREASVDVEVATPSGVAHATSGGGSDNGPIAIARALTYYHRPGAWEEPPNFFNPHWRAKLAPVREGIDRLREELRGAAGLDGLLPPLGDAATAGAVPGNTGEDWLDRILTH